MTVTLVSVTSTFDHHDLLCCIMQGAVSPAGLLPATNSDVWHAEDKAKVQQCACLVLLALLLKKLP